MGLKLANSAIGLLAAGVSDSATTLTLQAGHGSRFPTISSPDDFFPITVVRAQNPSQYELMRVTGRTGDTLTVQRMQEGTAALSFNPGDIVELRLTAGTLEDNFPQMSNRAAKNFKFSITVADGKDKLSFTGPNSTETILRQSDAQTNALDATAGRLLKVGAFGLGSMNAPLWPLTDLDAIPASVPSGMYSATGSHTNKPDGANGTVLWIRMNANYGFMEYQAAAASNGRKFLRFLNNNTWGSWQEIPHDGRLKTVGGQSLIGNGDITKTHLGLGNVENYPPASQSEAEAGAANDRYMTPLRTKQAIDALLASAFQGPNWSPAATGYQRLPSGLILQWATVSAPASTTTTVNWAIAFPSACLHANAIQYHDGGGATNFDVGLSGAPGKTSVGIVNGNTVSRTVTVFGIGF